MIWIDCFRDPVLRGPTIGSLLMALAASLVGVILFVRKRSLLGEALSHATYPGVILALFCSGLLSLTEMIPWLILTGAALSSLTGYFLIDLLERKFRVSNDAALCFVLALFFGLGITLASLAQNAYSSLFQQIQTYLYGQAATMTDLHIIIYGILSFFIVGMIFLFYKEILSLSFDKSYARTSGLPTRLLSFLLLLLVMLAVVIGIRSVGVILMSALLIAPAIAARQFTNRLSQMFILSGLFGMLSSYLGVNLSLLIPGMPTGPMMILVAGTFALLALLFAPERGLFIRYARALRFRTLQMQENLLKWFWRKGGEPFSFEEISRGQGFSKGELRFLLSLLILRGWIKKNKNAYLLTPLGVQRGGQIVRLHRLWEVYLVNALGLGVERVHKSAEEMEHILTPDLERKLTALLDDPKQDPHHQPIPSHEEVMRRV